MVRNGATINKIDLFVQVKGFLNLKGHSKLIHGSKVTVNFLIRWILHILVELYLEGLAINGATPSCL